MTPITCPSCGAALPEGAAACTYCGRRVAVEESISAAAADDAAAAPGHEAGDSAQRARSRRVLLVALVACGVVVALGVLVALLVAGAGSGQRAAVPTHRIEYRVSGTVREAGLTYMNATGGVEQRDEPLPWSHTLTVEEGLYVYVAALTIQEAGSIHCEILLDGQPWKEATSSGQGAVIMVTCGGVPDGR